MQILTRVILAVVIAMFFWTSAEAAFVAENYVTGQSFITTVAFSPDGRMYFIEKNTGMVKVVLGPNSVRPEPFYVFEVNNVGERGGLGLTFHPDYPDSPYVYCYVTIPRPVLANVIIRLVDSLGYGTHPDTIFRAPITVQASNHNGGNIHFGPDGKLYITMGENAQSSWAQDTCRVQGKILRINYDGSVPDDNPIHCAPIYAYGLRNSYDFCFHPATGILYASENGPDANDEVNRILPGRNYGWPIVQCRSDDPRYENALICWTPTIAPTGITIPWNSRIPEFNGRLLMSDWNTGTLHVLPLNSAGDSILADDHVYSIGVGLVDVEQGPDGDIYMSTYSGTIIRLRPPHDPPSQFPIYQPGNDSAIVSYSTRFTWGNSSVPDSAGSFQFNFQISEDTLFQAPLLTVNAGSDTSLSLIADSLLALGQAFYWRVLAIDNDSLVTVGGIPGPDIRRLVIVPTGDANRSGAFNTVDVVYLHNYLAGWGPIPTPPHSGDVNGDCVINGIDVSYMVNFFKGGPLVRRGDCL